MPSNNFSFRIDESLSYLSHQSGCSCFYIVPFFVWRLAVGCLVRYVMPKGIARSHAVPPVGLWAMKSNRTVRPFQLGTRFNETPSKCWRHAMVSFASFEVIGELKSHLEECSELRAHSCDQISTHFRHCAPCGHPIRFSTTDCQAR